MKETTEEKRYVWEPTDIIPISGQDFEIALHSVRLVYAQESGEKVFNNVIAYHTALQTLKDAIERTLQSAIQTGHVKEQVPELKVIDIEPEILAVAEKHVTAY